MAFSLATLWRVAFGPRPEVFCSESIWSDGVAELRKRTLGGTRESGAFLLGSKSDSARCVDEFVYYDDIDPDCLKTGIVVIDGRKLGKLWAHCKATAREVVADVHVHPETYAQSGSDKKNPVMPHVGHVALILPDFAQRAVLPGGIGVFEYRGGFNWRDRSVEKPSPFHVGWWPKWR